MSEIITKVEHTNRDGTIITKTITDVPEMSGYKWSKMDISGQGAGRTITSDALKKQVAQARTLELSWQNRDKATIAKVFQVFNTEYAWITFYDALTGTYLRRLFYMGDMTSDLYSMRVGTIWASASVKCVQSRTDKT